jgi:LmbE family N-acetylglucosaminyl deacetylase
LSEVSSESTAATPKHFAVITAHPDDPDFSCAGSCARWVSEGHRVTYVIITDGSKGSDDRSLPNDELVALRQVEQRAAAAILGVQEVIFMGYPDGMLVPNLDLRRDLVRVIRRIKPTAVVCGDPNSFFFGNDYLNHPDHRAAATAVLEAIFPAARNHRYFPELLDEGLEPHRVEEVYITVADGDTFVDISLFIDQKVAALKAHASQMGEWDPAEPIREWARKAGERATPPVEFAEDFRYMKLD